MKKVCASANAESSFSYFVYGLNIHSALPLPELAAGDKPADGYVRVASLDRPPPSEATVEGYFRVSAEEAHLYWEQVGTLLVREGREIVVDPNPEVEERVLRLYILGPALATLLRQRGRLVLHASVVAVDGEAVAFLGGSGWGKSTVSAAMYARGHKIVADDMAVLQVGERHPTVFPGFPQLKVWPETALFLNEAPERLPRLHPRLEKRAYRLSHGFASTPLPLKRIYVLVYGDGQRIEPFSAQEALVELIRHSYGARFLHDVETSAHFLRCASLASNIALRTLMTHRSLLALPSLVRLVEEDLAEST